MEEYKKINEGEVIADRGGFAVRVSHCRVSYSEGRKTVAYCDAEHSVNPYCLHVYFNTLEFVRHHDGNEDRRAIIVERIKAALSFLGTPFMSE